MSTFLIDEALGVSKEDYTKIADEAKRLFNSDMDMSEIVTEFAKGCNAHDVLVGFRLAAMVYVNEGRLK